MKTRNKFLISIIIGTFIFFNAFALPLAKETNNSHDLSQTNLKNKTYLTTSISYVVSTKDELKYCNGDDMDSTGFSKTITKVVTVPIPPQYLTREELIKKTIVLASEATQSDIIVRNEPNFLRVRGNTAYMAPIDGWAGVSIFLCSWQPFVEANLRRFPEIKKIIWEEGKY